MILLDTNLLVRITRPLDPQCVAARAAIQTCRARGERLVIVPQKRTTRVWSQPCKLMESRDC